MTGAARRMEGKTRGIPPDHNFFWETLGNTVLMKRFPKNNRSGVTSRRFGGDPSRQRGEIGPDRPRNAKDRRIFGQSYEGMSIKFESRDPSRVTIYIIRATNAERGNTIMDDNNGTGYSNTFWFMLLVGIIGVVGFMIVAGGGVQP